LRKQVTHRQIFDKDSQTAKLAVIVGDLYDEATDLKGLDWLLEAAILKDCQYFIKSSVSPCLCASGEINGKPFVKAACNMCIVGQFSAKGKFIGEIQELANVVDAILLPTSSGKSILDK
jgi:hypothetical protein